MINSSHASHLMNMFPKEFSLIYQAKSGDASAFVKLYDAYGERVYRYIYFLAPNNRVAEGLTFQVFFKAWEYLNRYQIFDISFVMNLYVIAQNQVTAYCLTHKKIDAPALADSVGDFAEEFLALRNGLQCLTAEQQQVLVLKFVVGMSNKNIARVIKRHASAVRVLQMYGLQALTERLQEKELTIDTKEVQPILEKCLLNLSNGVSTLDECLARYPKYAGQLVPLLEAALRLDIGRNVKPSPTFTTYTHDALIQYIRSHPRQQQIFMPILQRTALTFAMLVAVFLITGTAHAQSALPGEPFYGWKRTSEQAWLVLSSDPIATDITLSERRLNELIAVSNDPTLNTRAKDSYLEAVSRLQSAGVEARVQRILPVLQIQQEVLNNAGLPIAQLDDYLVVEVSSIPTMTPTHIIPTATQAPPTATQAPPTATQAPPTATQVPPTVTQVPPTTTDVPPTTTDVPPTAADIPPTATDIPPTATDVPPTATDVPPTATDVPPTATDIPPTATDILPTATDIPSIATDVPPTAAAGIP